MQLSLSGEEREMVFLLASQLTGTCQEGNFRHEILVTNVVRRMHKVRAESLEDYLEYVERHPKEMPHLLSALTIHTTNWFREKPHYQNFVGLLQKFRKEQPGKKFTMLSAACSTGEEVWSFGLVCEDFRSKNPGFEYEIHGRDIDPVSVAKAKKCIYNQTAMGDIPPEYKRFVLKGSGKTQGLFTLDKEIRKRCHFGPRSLTEEAHAGDPSYDYVVVRNVLIYFSPQEVEQIIQRLLKSLGPKGVLTVGHSEAIDYRKYGITLLGNSTYSKELSGNTATRESAKLSQTSSPNTRASSSSKYKVLVVDDSPTVRSMMCKLIEGIRFSTVAAESAAQADEILKTQSFDLITLDLHMPGKDGHEWLQEKRGQSMKTPVIIVSDANPAEAQKVLQVLGDGAQDYIEKKDLGNQKQAIQDRLLAIIEHSGAKKEVRLGDCSTDASKLEVFRPDLILLGASTGGTEALVKTLQRLPAHCPPVMVVQHISEDFASAFAQRLAATSGLRLAPHEPTEIRPGHLYMSIREEHIGIKKISGQYRSYFENSAKVSSHKPSVDFLFQTAEQCKDLSIVAALLTGMGKDGAQGLLKLRKMGALTMAQDAESSIVWGMPGEATKLGAPVFVGDTSGIRSVIDRCLMAPAKKKSA